MRDSSSAPPGSGRSRPRRRGPKKPVNPEIAPEQIRRVRTEPVPVFEYAPPTDPVRVLFEDDAIVVVDKPPKLLAVPGIAPEKQDCVRSRVGAMRPGATGPMTCHRLDLSTSGVMILALNGKVHRNLSKQFEFRKAAKRYIALLDGHLGRDEYEIHAPMRKDMDLRPLMLVDYIHGKPSATRVRVLARESLGGRAVTRVEMEPITGRTHQLRVHAAHPRVTTVGAPGEGETEGLDAPIVGDELYAIADAPRLMLHASMLTIHHPVTGRRVTFKAPDPF